MRRASVGLKLLVGRLALGRCGCWVVAFVGWVGRWLRVVANWRVAEAKRSHWVENSSHDTGLLKVSVQRARKLLRLGLVGSSSKDESSGGGCASGVGGSGVGGWMTGAVGGGGLDSGLVGGGVSVVSGSVARVARSLSRLARRRLASVEGWWVVAGGGEMFLPDGFGWRG